MSLFDDWNADDSGRRAGARPAARAPPGATPTQPQRAAPTSSNPFADDDDEDHDVAHHNVQSASNVSKKDVTKPLRREGQDADGTNPFLQRAVSSNLSNTYDLRSQSSAGDLYGGEEVDVDEAEAAAAIEDDASAQPRFALEGVDWKIGLGAGVSSLRSMAAGGGSSLLIVTAGNGAGEQVWLWLAPHNRKVQVQLSSHDPKNNPVHKGFVCPRGFHAFLSLENGDNYYVNLAAAAASVASGSGPSGAATVKGRGPIQRLKDVVIESVGWDRDNQQRDSTGTLLLGTSRGGIWEISVDVSRGSKEKKNIQKVYQLGMSIPVSGLEVVRLPAQGAAGGTAWFVMAVTARLTRFYEFIGGPTLEAMFKQYEAPEHQSFRELPGDMAYAELRSFTPSTSARPTSFMLLSEAGLYIGALEYALERASVAERVTSRHNMVYFPQRISATGEELIGPPLSAVETEFHYVLLYPSWLIVLSKLNESVVHERRIDAGRLGATLGLVWDPARAAIFVCSKLDIQRLLVLNEDGHVWKLYLDQARAGDETKFELALQKCKTDAQRDRVLSLRADHHLATGEFQLAAQYFAASRRSFEEVALVFIDQQERAALRTYLLLKLGKLPASQTTQRTMIAVWLVEIFLEAITAAGSPSGVTGILDTPRDAYNDENDAEETSSEKQQTQVAFHDFLSEYAGALHPAKDAIYKLIASHGRDADFLAYAKINGDYERVVVRHTLRGRHDLAVETLATEGQAWRAMNADPPAAFVNIFYKYSPDLIEHCPKMLVDTWIDSSFLDPCKLIPAIVRFTQSPAGKDPAEAIRYLEHCVNVQDNQSEAIHNLLFSLYAAQKDDTALREFLQSPNRCFDLKYALRVCSEHEQTNAAVDIYSILGLYAEAVELALKVDLELAKLNADLAQDAATRRKLWLMIAEHEIKDAVAVYDHERAQQGKGDAKGEGDAASEVDPIRRALLILTESDALTIEDVLQFLPDVVAIGELKDEICRTLEHYGQEIDSLKSEMNEFTTAADAIREEINAQNETFMVVNPDYSCDLCGMPVLERAFYVFPCTHAFHSTCLLSEVGRHLGKDQQDKMERLRSYIDLQEGMESQSAATTVPLLPGDASLEGDASDLSRAAGMPGHRGDRLALSKTDREKLAMLDNFVAAACPFCGDLMIQSITEPFITEEEEQDADAWAV
ncbi:Vacuolar protein sorting-associated protein 18-like [Hondaea fermentalgiana]|uniref:Vacuolar protein sorting-associated protein 18-like n=1 Tax=Hondaea fermentalgiana TaxID=2315210 RepID=A0A2R5GRX3_9STRA|nr:Vacuolar protein sorting-associated protein 18-like [Hondaea fermentalgiana]|eukprot:GBG32508.1 Vacuolar protein sorting-associated protein 18-like [Hondaea fermentalgiana]